MTSRTAQLARVFASLDAAPPADRWDDIPLVTTRVIPVDSDRITTMTADEWDAFVALKYGREGEE